MKQNSNGNLCEEIKALFNEQKEEWKFLNQKFDNLSHIDMREIKFDDFSICCSIIPIESIQHPQI